MGVSAPLLSIIIPTLNEERYLPILLNSIAKQTFRDFEIIVADAASSDRTAEIAQARGAKVVAGGKVSVGRNNGARAAKGKILLFFDADVVLPDNRFLEETVGEFLERGFDVGTCHIEPVDGNRSDLLMYRMYNAYTAALERLLPHMPGFCVYVKRSVHEAIEGFDETIKLAEDHDYARRASKIGAFGFLTCRCIPVSTRRFSRDGRFKTTAKYVAAEVHMLALGPITSDIFKYGWGHSAAKKE